MQILWSVILGPTQKRSEIWENSELKRIVRIENGLGGLEKIIKNASDKMLIAKPIFGIFIIFKCDTIPIH